MTKNAEVRAVAVASALGRVFGAIKAMDNKEKKPLPKLSEKDLMDIKRIAHGRTSY